MILRKPTPVQQPGTPSELEQLANRCATAFTRRFGASPEHITHAPGRINLLGEHVDYTGGLVLPMAIDRWTVTCIGGSESGMSCYRAEDLDREWAFDISDPIHGNTEPQLRHANHVLGVFEAIRNSFGRKTALPQVNFMASGNIPIGAGLSSSAALEVATVMACDALGDQPRSALDVASIAQQVEHDFVGTPCGIMDMLVSSAATSGHALLIDCRSMTWSSIPLPPEQDLAIMVVDTGTSHELASSAYAERRAACKRVEGILDCSLRIATDQMLEEADLTDIDRRRARHVIQENARVEAASRALEDGDLKQFGSLLLEGHESLKSLFEVTTPELDLVVEVAANAPDDAVYGARMTGGGFGGSVIVLTRPEKTELVRRRINDAFSTAFNRFPQHFMVSAVDGAGVWR